MLHNTKRGSHIGMIASFSLFVVFLLAIYFITQAAIRTPEDKSAYLELVEIKLRETFSSQLITVIANHSAGCASLPESLSGVSAASYAIATSREGEAIPTNYSGDAVYFDTTAHDPVFIYYSNETLSAPFALESGCTEVDVHSIQREDVIYEQSIIDGVSELPMLRDALNLPQSQFSFSFTFANGTTLDSPREATTKQVFARDVRMTYYNASAQPQQGVLHMYVW